MNKEKVKFHVKNDDYFGTLATVLDLVRQNLNPFNQKKEKSTLEGAVKDLMHLQKNYRIVDKKH